MYLNLKWLAENKYPHDKIIVWAANTHVSKTGFSDDNYTNMGEWIASDSNLKNLIYSIGFTSFSGESGRLNAKKYSIPAGLIKEEKVWFIGLNVL